MESNEVRSTYIDWREGFTVNPSKRCNFVAIVIRAIKLVIQGINAAILENSNTVYDETDFQR